MEFKTKHVENRPTKERSGWWEREIKRELGQVCFCSVLFFLLPGHTGIGDCVCLHTTCVRKNNQYISHMTSCKEEIYLISFFRCCWYFSTFASQTLKYHIKNFSHAHKHTHTREMLRSNDACVYCDMRTRNDSSHQNIIFWEFRWYSKFC